MIDFPHVALNAVRLAGWFSRTVGGVVDLSGSGQRERVSPAERPATRFNKYCRRTFPHCHRGLFEKRKNVKTAHTELQCCSTEKCVIASGAGRDE